jgi:membrane-bound lytic murein transglycosylase D
VERAIARNRARGRPTDYESLRMPAETRNYLPKLQAVKNIVADPERFGVTLPVIPNEPYFATTTVQRHIDLEVAAKLAEIPVEEFRFLNPAHNKPVINADSAETIVLPKEKLATFLTNLNSYEEPLATWQAYKVKPGESDARIAKKFGISVAELRRINNLSSRSRLHPGQALLVPVQAGAEPEMPSLPAPRASRRTRSASTQKAPSKKKPAAKAAKAPTTPAKSASAKPRKPGSKLNVAETH